MELIKKYMKKKKEANKIRPVNSLYSSLISFGVFLLTLLINAPLILISNSEIASSFIIEDVGLISNIGNVLGSSILFGLDTLIFFIFMISIISLHSMSDFFVEKIFRIKKQEIRGLVSSVLLSFVFVFGSFIGFSPEEVSLIFNSSIFDIVTNFLYSFNNFIFWGGMSLFMAFYVFKDSKNRKNKDFMEFWLEKISDVNPKTEKELNALEDEILQDEEAMLFVIENNKEELKNIKEKCVKKIKNDFDAVQAFKEKKNKEDISIDNY